MKLIENIGFFTFHQKIVFYIFFLLQKLAKIIKLIFFVLKWTQMIKNSLKKWYFFEKQPYFLKYPFIFTFYSSFHFLALYYQYITHLTTRYAKYLIFYHSYTLYIIENKKINVFFSKIAYNPVNRNVSLIFHCVIEMNSGRTFVTQILWLLYIRRRNTRRGGAENRSTPPHSPNCSKKLVFLGSEV